MKTNSLRWPTALLMGSLAAVSLSQTKNEVIRPFRQIETGPAVVMSTSDFSPQISQRFEFTARELSPNATPWVIPDGTPNNLKAGAVTTKANSKVSPRFPGIGFTGFVPPDPDIAVGPNHIVSVVNSDVAFFNKATGAKTFQQTGDGSGFFTGIGVQSNFTFDPKCYFDRLSNRFFVLFLEADTGSAAISKVLIAVSDDADPNGTWFKYRIEAKVTEGSNSFWLDYPGFAVNKDAVVFTGNMFPFATGGVFTQVVVLPKAPMLTGGSVTATSLKDATMFTLQPTRTFDGAQANMYGVSAQTGTTIRLVALTQLLSSPTLIKTDVTVPTWTRPSDVPKGGGGVLDGLDGRLYNAHFRNGRIVTAHTTKAPDGRMQARWYEFAVNSWPASGSPALRQSGNILLGGTNTHMPAINTNSAGDISVIYSRNNASTNPDTCISSRFAADALGSIGAPQVIATGSGTYGGGGFNRWGDYFGCEIDPVDNLTFWGIGMVAAPGGVWVTHINKWTVSSGTAGVLIAPIAETLIQGTYIGGALADLLASDNNRYSIRSILIDKNGQPTIDPAQATGQVASLQVDFDLDLSGGPVADLKAVVESNVSLSGPTGQLFAFNWNTGTFVSIGSFAQATTDKKATITIPKASLGNYVDLTGNVRLMVRAFSPIRGGRPNKNAPQFLFNIDQVA
ncbi:MAG: hypothetical protein H7Y17_16995, partial [Chlorobia bacterium]|nr:hypothetical protein [Fimbriimonadaceae bacterium]